MCLSTANLVLSVAILHGLLFDTIQSVDPPAKWMPGKLGRGFCIGAGDYIERCQTGDHDWGLTWTKLVEQYTSVGASWVIVNLSKGAHGTMWMAHHPVLYKINTPPDPDCVPGSGGGNGWDSSL
jgi:hypothetical protein